jgi:hypothetical protein
MLLVSSAGAVPRKFTGVLKTEPDWSLLDSVRDDRFKQPRICVWGQLYDPEIVQVRLRGDLLNVVRLSILDIDHIFSSVLKPADLHEITKGPEMRLRPYLSAFAAVRVGCGIAGETKILGSVPGSCMTILCFPALSLELSPLLVSAVSELETMGRESPALMLTTTGPWSRAGLKDSGCTDGAELSPD